jgi:hypothetical protein
MATRELGIEGQPALEQVLGYLNFSAGAADPQFLANLNLLFGLVGGEGSDGTPWRELLDVLRAKLQSLQSSSPTFRDADQAAAIVGGLLDHVLKAYLEFHRDLLFHQTDQTLFGPLFIGRVCEAILRQGPPWNESDRIARVAIGQLNDYIGYRPVAVLQSRKVEPYAHEWVRPVPLFIRGVGAAVGRHREVVDATIRLLEQTDEDLLRAACFDPTLLEELAFDPRAYDFDHPANKRPNYHFGQWDPHLIDNQGRYRRFVVQQVTLDALMSRIEEPSDLPHDELLFEAASVLAGTVLMAAGISGNGPDSHDSNVTLSNLLPHIAAYRDAFYERLLARTQGQHAERLKQEAAEKRQPFGGARQHLNARLARRRAAQLEHVQLAKIFARMGYAEAATRQSDVVPVASARTLCRIDCRLTAAHQAILAGDVARAAPLLPEIIDLLRRAINCGAVVDPWNILGFDAHFSLFPALENSIHDHRVDELVALMEQILALYSRVWSEAAAVDDRELCRRINAEFHETATWWRQFAAHEVSSVEAIDALDAHRAAQRVAEALNLWHKGGAAAGDVAFWAPYAEMFDSPKAYALVIDALLQRRDFVAAMALLIHWLGNAENVPLLRGDSSFHQLAERWLVELQQPNTDQDAAAAAVDTSRIWPLARKFFDYVEANAGDYGRAPHFELGGTSRVDPAAALFSGHDEEEEEDEEDADGLFSAAYEDVVFRDSTDDGVEGSILDDGSVTDDELERESKRIAARLLFLSCLARQWKLAAVGPALPAPPATPQDAVRQHDDQRLDTLRNWIRQARDNRRQLMQLLDAVERHRIPTPSGDHDSMVEYDRRRMIKESLLERIIETTVETADAVRLLSSALAAQLPSVDVVEDSDDAETVTGLAAHSNLYERQAVAVFAAMLRRDISSARRQTPHLMTLLDGQPLLYVPLSKGGDPRNIVATRIRQQTIRDLLAWLPRLGLLTETCRLIETAREMERNHPVGPGAVTEFDDLFAIGYKALVESLTVSAELWAEKKGGRKKRKDASQSALVACLEQLTESLLASWLAHSRTLRLSVLEKVKDKDAWKHLVEFIQRYGSDLFTQKFFNLANVRAILHEGVDQWLQQLQDDPRGAPSLKLLDELEKELPREQAVEHLSLVLEAILENYGEYRDYNSTTTQSDRGELLFMLLDFLRLRAKYDRIAWNLKPVVWAHEILVRGGHHEAAQLWRRSLSERIGEEADRFLSKLAELQKVYAMRMPTVADRLAERFSRPLLIDRIRALVEPAMREAAKPGLHPTFELLEHEVEWLTREPTGVGLDIPSWLLALEEEVETVRNPTYHRDPSAAPHAITPPVRLGLEELQEQLDDWTDDDDE